MIAALGCHQGFLNTAILLLFVNLSKNIQQFLYQCFNYSNSHLFATAATCSAQVEKLCGVSRSFPIVDAGILMLVKH